ncbi:MAG: nucleotidyl transferase AbiEii/AbiGii toxin family protein [Nitrospirae bacterium]|nr:nucleotidyl transferase AbiEii/AbiGii toxin family protein [Nitrospirota bacterium]
MPIRWHADDPGLLVQAIELTARRTGFQPRLVEKDYFCSVVLEYLAACDADLTFKGGTSLAKVHGSFYRLSEDLDFSISTPLDASRKERSRRAEPLKLIVGDVPKRLPGLRILEPLRGANESTQYNAIVGYESLLDSHIEPIGIEVGQREPTLTAPHRGSSRTMLLNPANERPLLDAFPVTCLSHQETMAEKLRAALTRKDVAIRDFFDLDYAVRKRALDTRDRALLDLLRRKLEVPGTGRVDVSPDRVAQLRQQLATDLQPVLREQDFAEFDLERAVRLLDAVVRTLG